MMKYKAAHKKGCFFIWLFVAVVASVVWEKTRGWFAWVSFPHSTDLFLR